MKRYEERPRGVFDRTTGELVFPHTEAWGAYQRYVAETGEEPDPMPPGEGMTLEQLRTEKRALVENKAGELRKAFVGRAHPAEMALWPAKIAEARAYLAEPGSPLTPPLLRAEALARGTSVDALAALVVNNAIAHAKAEAAIAGAAGKHKDALAGLKTLEELDAYDIDAGWPEVTR